MLRLIEGPKRYLTDKVVVPQAFCVDTDLHAYHATEWLLECASNVVNSGESTWDEFWLAEDFLSKYVLKFKEDETSEVHERELTEDDITTQGATILDTFAQGEDVDDLFMEWRFEIFGQIADS